MHQYIKYIERGEEDSGGGTHAVRRAQGLDVGLVHARDARERGAEERAGRFVDALADERWLAVLGLFVGGQVLSRFVRAVCDDTPAAAASSKPCVPLGGCEK